MDKYTLKIKGTQILYVIMLMCVLCEVFFSYFSVGFFPLRNYFLILGFTYCLFLATVITHYKFVFLKYLTIVVVLMTLVQLSYLPGASPQAFFYSIARNVWVPFAIYLLVYNSIRLSEKRSYNCIKFLTLLISISAIIAVLQLLQYQFAWSLRTIVPMDVRDVGTLVDLGLQIKTKAYGLAYNPVSLGYQLSIAFPLLMYLGITHSNAKFLTKFFLFFAIFAFAIICVFNNLRTFQISFFFTLLIMLSVKFHHKINIRNKKIAWPIIVVSILGLCSVFLWLYLNNAVINDENADVRLGLFKISLLYVYENPFGSGGTWDLFNQYKLQYLLDNGYSEHVTRKIIMTAPHNAFLNVAILHGCIGLFLMISAYFYFIVNLTKIVISSYRSGAIDWLPLVLLSSVYGLVINSTFHNSGVFIGGYFEFYIFAICSSVLAVRQNKEKNELAI